MARTDRIKGAALGSGVDRSRAAMPEILVVALQQMTAIDWIVRSVQKPTYSRDNSSRKQKKLTNFTITTEILCGIECGI